MAYVHGSARFLDLLARRWLLAAILTGGFALLARLLRGVTPTGAAAGGAVGFVLYVGAGPGAFVALVAVFALTWFATRLGHGRKLKLGIAERPEGRTASQVLANLGVAAGCATIYAAYPTNAGWLVALAAALSEVAADTVSSEVGQAFSKTARLITTWAPVKPGTDGAMSIGGTLAGASAAILVTTVCAWTRLISWQQSGVAVGAAIAGTIVDSLLGATLERYGILNNDAVNFLSTLAAALIALAPV